MKKILAVMLGISIIMTGLIFENKVSAASTYKDSVTLTTALPNISTVRVNSNGLLDYNVINTGRYNVSFRIFQDGSPLGGKIYISPGQRNTAMLMVPSSSEYSLRVYCESSTGKGCTAGVSLNGKP